eukprot:scaffold204_cov113-Isochrysis_galbana.AAC.5
MAIFSGCRRSHGVIEYCNTGVSRDAATVEEKEMRWKMVKMRRIYHCQSLFVRRLVRLLCVAAFSVRSQV